MDNFTEKHLLYKQFAAWACNGCSTVPLTDYINNLVYQELIDESDYGGVKSDERIHLDLRASAGYTTEAEKLERNDSKVNLTIQLKKAARHKLMLRVLAKDIPLENIYTSYQVKGEHFVIRHIP